MSPTPIDILTIPPCRIIRDYLIEAFLGVAYDEDTDWSIAVAATPEKPINVITIFDEASTKQYRSHDQAGGAGAGFQYGGGVHENYGIVIEIRSNSYVDGWMKALLLMMCMDKLHRWEWTGSAAGYPEQVAVFSTAIRQRGIFPLGKDENGKWLFNLEYELVLQSLNRT